MQLVQAIKYEPLNEELELKSQSPLVDFLLSRAIENNVLGNYLYWYMTVECEDPVYGKLYAKMAFEYLQWVVEHSQVAHQREALRRQAHLVDSLTFISKTIKSSRESRMKKVELLQKSLSNPKLELLSFPPMALPLDPRIYIVGIIPGRWSISNIRKMLHFQ